MELSDYIEIINRRKWIIITTGAIVIAVVITVSFLLPKTYSATTVLRILLNTKPDSSYIELIYADRIMNTYVQVANSQQVLTELREILNLDPDQPSDINVEIIPETELLEITVEDLNPYLAREAANALALIILNQEPLVDSRISVVDPAVTPEPYTIMDYLAYFVIALFLGGVAGLGAGFLAENLDPRLHTKEVIRETSGLSVFGEIPTSGGWSRDKYRLVYAKQNDAYRRLRINVLTTAQKYYLKTIMINSAQPDEGKSTVTANLACSIAQIGYKVIVIDSDMYRPSMHKYFKISNQVGLSSVLENKKNLSQVIQRGNIAGLDVLTSGPFPDNPTELLAQSRVSELLELLKKDYDLVFVDSPATLGVPDATILAPKMDAVLLVVRHGYVREDSLRYTLNQFEKLKTNTIGLILNRVKSSIPSTYSKYYKRRGSGRSIYRLRDRIQKSIMPSDKYGKTNPSAQVESHIEYDPFAGSTVEMDTVTIRDPLTEIKGLGPFYEKELNAIGIYTYEDLVQKSPEELAMNLDGARALSHIQKYGWIEQAQSILEQENHKDPVPEDNNRSNE